MKIFNLVKTVMIEMDKFDIAALKRAYQTK